MKLYPVTIIDDFFINPDYIREYALSLKYPIAAPNFPGCRTQNIFEFNPQLGEMFSKKVLKIFGELPDQCIFNIFFQKIKPFSKDKWDITNKGWVHTDEDALFAGVVYLNPKPDPDTGTSIYKCSTSLPFATYEENLMKENLYSGMSLNKEKYETTYNNYHAKMEETVTVKNQYNRLLLFDTDTLHGVPTFGIKERLTISFFCIHVGSLKNKINKPPLLRA